MSNFTYIYSVRIDSAESRSCLCGFSVCRPCDNKLPTSMAESQLAGRGEEVEGNMLFAPECFLAHPCNACMCMVHKHARGRPAQRDARSGYCRRAADPEGGPPVEVRRELFLPIPAGVAVERPQGNIRERVEDGVQAGQTKWARWTISDLTAATTGSTGSSSAWATSPRR